MGRRSSSGTSVKRPMWSTNIPIAVKRLMAKQMYPKALKQAKIASSEEPRKIKGRHLSSLEVFGSGVTM